MAELFPVQGKELVLRDYQLAALENARENIRNGNRRQLLCSPTGSGKTVIALGLMQAATAAGTRSVFITDRSALVDQTSAAMDEYGISHGIMQASHWRQRPQDLVQLVSAQTLGRRLGRGGYVDSLLRDLRFVLIDEAHTLYKGTTDWLSSLPESVSVIGLTATPFTKGLGQHYQAIINVASTDSLIQSGMLTQPLVYAAVEIDTTEVAVRSTGEWDEHGLEQAGVRIVGDVVSEFIKRSHDHFGGPVKTIVFSSTVAHGEEICRAFAEVGLNFQNISYRDDEDERREKISEFRKPDSAITGLVSCDALAKGFDVPDVKICILCRPLRKSLTTHLQQIGRIMRPAPGKEKALVIDHTGNALRFLNDTVDFWANGVDTLDESAEKDRNARNAVTPKERKELVCLGCQALLPPRVSACLSCGRERPHRQADVVSVKGVTKLLQMNARSGRNFDYQHHAILQHPAVAYQSFLAFATHRKKGDVEAGRRWAAGLFKGAYGRWPASSYGALPHNPDLLTLDVERFCRKEMSRYAKSRADRAA